MHQSQDAEDCYLEIYQKVIQYSDIFQPEPETGRRLLLPEIIMTSLVTTIVTAFLSGAFQEMGKDIYLKAKELFHEGRKLETSDPKLIVHDLDRALNLKEKPDFEKGEQAVISRLIDAGISKKKARKIAKDTISTLKKRLDR